MTLLEALTSGERRLNAAHIGFAHRNAELLLMFVLGCGRAQVFAYPERQLTDDEAARYEDVITQRASGVPVQYITGHQEFWGLDFIVTSAVLIPRPETEHLIEATLELVSPQQALHPRHLRLIDVGTGSGCIAVALAKEIPAAEIHATDISGEALEIARANAARHDVESRIKFRQGDLLAGSESAGFDFVVANPPYVGEGEEDQVQMEVRKFEPRNAVFAGPSGLEVIERLIPQAQEAMKPQGWLLMEISGSIADGVKALLEPWLCVEIRNDLQGIPRVALGQKP